MKHTYSRRLVPAIIAGLLAISNVWAQTEPVRNWAAPLYWQPSAKESKIVSRAGETRPDVTPAFVSSAPLVFVAVTPCRMMDTRGYDPTFTGIYGPPALGFGGTRTLPVAGVTAGYCNLPVTAQAVSLNVTLWPTPGTQVQWITLWPNGQSQPAASTINDYQGTLFSPANGITMYGVNNAAIVPLGSAGAFNVYVTDSTNLFIDVNGYYLPPSALALGAGTAAAPSLTFSTDTGSGLYSPAAGTVDITASGANILAVNTTGISVTGNISNTGTIIDTGCTAPWCLQTPTALVTTNTANYIALEANSNGSGSTKGVLGAVTSASGVAGEFQNTASTGTALLATVNSTTVMSADQNGVHAGPGLTGTPFAYGAFDSSANKLAGSGNISCFVESTWYGCELFSGSTQIAYDATKYVVVVTELATTYNAYPRFASVFLDNSYTPNRIGLYFYGINGTSSVTVTDGVSTDFSIAVYKP